MDLARAVEVLGVEPGTPLAEVRAAYLRLLRATHPDVAPDREGATERTAGLTAAFAVVRTAVLADGNGVVPVPAAPPTPTRGDEVAPRARPWEVDRVDAEALEDDDTDARLAITAPPAEAYALLMEAASRVGSIGYVDRRLGILEVLVRFEGGPTCSVLCTLRGRPFLTEVGCAMESIEATPTPPIRPVVEALVQELRRPGGWSGG